MAADYQRRCFYLFHVFGRRVRHMPVACTNHHEALFRRAFGNVYTWLIFFGSSVVWVRSRLNSFWPGIWRYMLPEDVLYFRVDAEQGSSCFNCPQVKAFGFHPAIVRGS